MTTIIKGSGGGAKYLGDATVAEVMAGKKFYSNDKTLKTGTAQKKAAQTYTPGTANQTIPAGVITTGVQTILGDTDLKPENIRDGIDIFGKVGILREVANVEYADVVPSSFNLTIEKSPGQGTSAYNQHIGVFNDDPIIYGGTQSASSASTSRLYVHKIDLDGFRVTLPNLTMGGYQTGYFIDFKDYFLIAGQGGVNQGRKVDKYDSDYVKTVLPDLSSDAVTSSYADTRMIWRFPTCAIIIVYASSAWRFLKVDKSGVYTLLSVSTDIASRFRTCAVYELNGSYVCVDDGVLYVLQENGDVYQVSSSLLVRLNRGFVRNEIIYTGGPGASADRRWVTIDKFFNIIETSYFYDSNVSSEHQLFTDALKNSVAVYVAVASTPSRFVISTIGNYKRIERLTLTAENTGLNSGLDLDYRFARNSVCVIFRIPEAVWFLKVLLHYRLYMPIGSNYSFVGEPEMTVVDPEALITCTGQTLYGNAKIKGGTV